MPHPDTSLPRRDITDAYSLEVSTRDIAALSGAAARMPPGATVSIPYLARDDDAARLAAARAVRDLGFTPMPHLSARRIASRTGLETFIQRAVAEAGADRCFVIAGDANTPMGPFADSGALIDTGMLERAGIRQVGIGGHPDEHPVMSPDECWTVLQHKCDSIEQRGMAPVIITQFTFDADVVLTWLQALRQRGIDHPVRIGVPGPANIAVLARYAALCGVSACASMLGKYGIALGKLLGSAGPDLFVERLASGLTDAHGDVQLHFFPFGGIAQSVQWIERYRARGAPP